MSGQGTDPRRRLRSELIGAFGTIVEWYDFSLYVYLAPVYARVFFGGGGDDSGGLIATFAVFGVAYLARPLGAAFFGSLGDRIGRKLSLTASASIMAVALLINGLLPSEASIGVAAAVLLTLTRLAMGFAVGGEYSGILVYLTEVAEDRRRGFVASWSPATAGLGSLLAVAVSALVTTSMSQEALDAWGWRIPLFIGAGLAFAVLALRRQLGETDAFEAIATAQQTSRRPLRDAVRTARGAVLLAFALSAVGSLSYYLNIVFVPTYLGSYEGVSASAALRWSTIATAVMLISTPAFGLLSDRFGRRVSLSLVGLTIALTTVPLYAWLGDDALIAVLVACALAVTAGAWSAVAAAAIPEQLPGHIRFSGLALGYNVATAVFGGFTPLVATVLIEATGSALAPAAGCALFGLIGAGLAWTMRETARRPLAP
ncbi:MAG: MFS transporter [Actinomycetota bacterium]